MLWFNFIPLAMGFNFISFVLNALSYIRDCTLFMAKGGGGGGGGGGGDFKKRGKGGFIF